jgi:iron complex outermembrane recepter protein
MMKRSAAALLASVAFGSPAWGDDAAADDGEQQIVVTGQRQAYRGDFKLQETPQAISVIGPQQLDQNNVTRLSDALDLNASVARQNNFGGLWDAYAVRGFVGDQNLPSGYLVNGFNGGRGFGGTRDAAGIERIEILKGPNAALFGRGEPGGTANIVTKRADLASSRGRINLLGGSFDRYRADADINLAADDLVAVRLVGFYEDAGSFRDTIESERFGFLPSVLLKLSERTSLTYDLEITRAEVPFDRGVVAVNGRLGLIPRSRFLGEPADGPIEADATGQQLQLQHDFSDAWSLLLGGSYRETRLEGFSTEAELARNRQRLFRDGRSLSRQRRFRRYEAEHLVFRGELSGRFETAGLTHRVLIGADYDKFDNSQFFLRSRPAVLNATTTPQASNDIDILNPVYGRFPLPNPGPQTNRLDTQTAWGVYLQDQITLTDRLQVRLGGRYDNFSLRSLNRANGRANRRSATRFSPQAGIVYELSDAVSLYAAYGEGFRANIGADVNGRVFDPETTKSGEIGAKLSLFSGRLTGTLAAFELKKRNVLAADPANPGFSLPIGAARSRGLELDLNGKLPGGVDLWFSYAYVDAEALKDVLDPDFALAIRAGDPLINIPEHSANLQLAKTFAVGGSEVTVGGGVQHVGERLGEAATIFFLPDYTLVRAFASWRVSERVELFGELTNLFDETFYSNSFSTLWVQPGQPRAASVRLSYSF